MLKLNKEFTVYAIEPSYWYYWYDNGWTLGDAQYKRMVMLVGHWELPSTTTCFCWWTLGAARYDHTP